MIKSYEEDEEDEKYNKMILNNPFDEEDENYTLEIQYGWGKCEDVEVTSSPSKVVTFALERLLEGGLSPEDRFMLRCNPRNRDQESVIEAQSQLGIINGLIARGKFK